MLLVFSMATLVGMLNRLEPDTILLRAATASLGVGVLVRVALGLVVTTPAAMPRGKGEL